MRAIPRNAGQAPVVTGGEVAENAARFRTLLGGGGSLAEQDITILNTAALLLTAGHASDLRDGADQAREALLSGRAGAVLDAYVEATRG